MTAHTTLERPTSTPITPAMYEGELRILDTDLAVRLGFAKATKIRDLIKRHKASLEKMGPLPTVGRVINGGAATEHYLNKKQAIFITAKSETAEATAITIEIIERFDAYERGASSPKVPTNMREALLLALEQQEKLDEQGKELEIVRPKAAAHDYLAELPGELGVRDAGRELKVGQKWVTDYIDGHGWSCVEGGKRKPTHYGIKHSYCRLVSETFNHRQTGEEMVRDKFRLTRKGIGRLAEIIAKLQKENGVPFAKKREAAA
ncbi:phage antirepressor KilAC domain-containing protein [Gluconacetobacter azotocaptans]|uniref:phage antirepressor KilAC domain-containing protein n=1 Tax=Gluconacetobacter azotocaptans TaxID=142834 RepID=UPI00195C56D1|nr:phage antirepressor KilAC domain-containing protein [Gluconacetobacter azotocaptans]MBM9401571.1 phage antirepressor KilAC domain-containing protein [Gluconacetobacter azotocaptans]